MVAGFLLWWRLTRSLFSLFGLFLIASILFNGGQIILAAFGLSPSAIVGGRFTGQELASVTGWIGIAIAVLVHGGLVGATGNVARRNAESITIFKPYDRGLLTVACLFLLLSLPAAIEQTLEAAQTAISSGYAALYSGTRDVGTAAISQRLAQLVIPGSLLLLAAGRRYPLARFISQSIALLYCGGLLLIGIRGWAVLYLLGYSWTWHRVIRPLRLSWLAVPVVALAIIAIPTISSMRNLEGEERLSIARVVETITTTANPLQTLLYEFGYQLRTVAHTMELVPKVREFDLGRSYAVAASTLLPNFSNNLHFAKRIGTPGDWLVEEVEPVIAARGGGLGYSFIAEAYLNFGWPLGLLIIFILGLILGMLSNMAEVSTSTLTITLFGILICFLPFYARSDLSTILRPIIWYPLLSYILLRAFNGVRFKPRTRHGSTALTVARADAKTDEDHV